jgi:membrane associated rhomboid family serine protease
LFLPGSTAWLLGVQMPLLFLAGRHLERIIGRRHLLGLFFLTGAIGGLAQLAYDAWVQPRADNVVLLGLTAPTVGVFAALAGIVPELELVPPLALSTGSHGPAWLRIKHGAVAVLVLLAVGLLVRPAGGFAAQEAVRGLAGGLTGCLCVRQLGFGRRRRTAQTADPEQVAQCAAAEAAAEAVSMWSHDEPHPTAVAAPVAAAAGALVVPRFTERERRMSAREYITEQIDPILEKIFLHGIGSLTDSERRVLAKGREKMVANKGD